MKSTLAYGAIPFALIFIFIILPKMIANLINSHTDIGLYVIMLSVCLVFGVVFNIFVELYKENDNEL